MAFPVKASINKTYEIPTSRESQLTSILEQDTPKSKTSSGNMFSHIDILQ